MSATESGGILRRGLDALYRLSGGVAALFLMAIFVAVVIQVFLNLFDSLSDVVTGAPVGLLLPSYAEFAGYFLAATTFFALAYTLRAGAHIRVSLLLQGLPAGVRHWVEVWCCALGAGISIYFLVHTLDMTYDSWRFNDVSYGLVPIPIWLPQTAMCLGLLVLCIALVDEFFHVLSGARPTYDRDEGLLGGTERDGAASDKGDQ